MRIGLQAARSVLVGCLLTAVAPCFAQPELETWIRESQFVFEGTVRRLAATTMAEAPATEATIVVSVDQVLQAPPALKEYQGKEITVLLRNPGSVNGGQRFVFFTDGWLFGGSIAVREVGRLQAAAGPQAMADLKTRIDSTTRALADRALQSRLATAEVVIEGRVVALQRPAVRQAHRSDPLWMRAVVQVRSVLKGRAIDGSVDVFFPRSMYPVWARSPKFKVGDAGIWLLRSGEIEELVPLKGWTALDPLDYQAASNRDRIERLVSAKPAADR